MTSISTTETDPLFSDVSEWDTHTILVREIIKDSSLTALAFTNLSIFTAVLFSAAGLYVYAVITYIFITFILFGFTVALTKFLIPKLSGFMQLAALVLITLINDLALASILFLNYFAPMQAQASLSAAISIVISMGFISVPLAARYFIAFMLSRVTLIGLCGFYVYFSLTSPGGLTEYIATLTIALLVMLILGYWLVMQKCNQIKLRLELERAVNVATQAQQQSAEDYDLRKRLISYIGHDLRQPIHALDYMLIAMEQRNGSQQDTLSMLSDARECVGSASRMIEDVVQISHFDSAKIDVRPSLNNINNVLEQLVREYEKPCKAGGVKLKHVSTSICFEFDSELLMRILRNLIKNAVRYAHGDKILLGLRRSIDRYEIWVVDNGCGMQIDEESFIVTSASKKADYSDQTARLGIGLKISRRLAQACGGQLLINSRLKYGTCCRVIIPKK